MDFSCEGKEKALHGEKMLSDIERCSGDTDWMHGHHWKQACITSLLSRAMFGDTHHSEIGRSQFVPFQ